MATRQLSVLALGLLLVTIALTTPGIRASAQQESDQLPPPPDSGAAKSLPMQSVLFEAAQLAKDTGASPLELRAELARRGITVDDNGRVHVEIVGPIGSPAVSQDAIALFGGAVSNTWRHRSDAWIPASRLVGVARILPPGYFMERAALPGYDDVVGEGPAATGSDEYRDGGADCSGVTIGTIDGGHDNLTEARNNGDAPTLGNSTQINYTPNTFEDPNDGTHGTGVVEAIFDHCPGATYRIYKIDSLTDMGTAVDNGIVNGVDIFSHSLSRYNQGWADNSGDACAAANDAASNGMIFFTSAGNRAQQHWQGNFNTGPDADNWHNWAGGDDETINISVANGGSGSYYLSWDKTGDTYDYDLYLYDSTLTSVLAASTNSGNNYESFTWQNNTGSTQTVHLAVFRDSGGTTEMEVFLHGSGTWLQHAEAEGSTTSPSNCTNANVASVGAVGRTLYGSTPGSTVIKSYSSQGPSNSGMTLPDIVGPTDTTGFTYPGGFTGTSSATPNAAGTAGAFWSSALSLNSDGVRYLVFEKAKIFKAWGDLGTENVYGRGGISLYTYQANTVWVDRAAGNTGGASTLPYYFIADAQSAAVNGGRVVILGDSYPEAVTLNKDLLFDSIGPNAVLGD